MSYDLVRSGLCSSCTSSPPSERPEKHPSRHIYYFPSPSNRGGPKCLCYSSPPSEISYGPPSASPSIRASVFQNRLGKPPFRPLASCSSRGPRIPEPSSSETRRIG